MILVTTLSLALATPLVVGDDTNDWLHWGGPNRNGVSTEHAWSSVGKTADLWSKELGLGYSNVVIADGRLFTRGYDLDAGEDTLWCLDPATGREFWSQRSGADHLANFHGGGTLSTPTVDGDKVYTANRFGQFFCRRVSDGEIVWQRDYRGELELTVPFHGFAASPLIIENDLIITLGGTTIAASKADGAVKWKTQDYGDGGYSNPIPMLLRDRDCLAVFAGVGLLVLDRNNGEELHRHPWKSNAGGVNAAAPILLDDDRVFISSAYQMGCAMLDLSGDELEPVWENKRMRSKVSECMLWDDHIYGFDESMLKCINLEGKEMWRVRGLGMGSVSVAGGRLIVLSSKGELIIADASPGGFNELSRQRIFNDGVCWTAPIMHDGRIYCRNSMGTLVVRDHSEAVVATIAGEATETVGEIPAAASLFARHVESIGGSAALRKHSSAHIAGEIEILGAGITRTGMTIDMKAPNKWLLTYDLGPAGTVYRGFDGEVGWQLDPFYGEKIYQDAELKELKETRRFHGDLEYETLYTSLKTSGVDTFADRDCWVVDTVSAGGNSRRLYFDRSSGLLVGRDGENESMVVFEDYKPFDGVLYPTRTTMLIPDTGAEESYYIKSITFDTVDDAVFTRPAKVIRMLRTPEQIEAENAAARKKYAKQLGAYIADFEPYNGARFTIRVNDGILELDIAGSQQFALDAPDEQGRFMFTGMGGLFVSFVEDAEGAIVAMKLSNRGQENELKRAAD